MNMIMMMVVAVLLLPVHGHPHMCSRDSALYGGFRAHVYPGNAQCVHLVHKGTLLLLRQEFQQCRAQHVTGRAHAAVQI